MIEIRHLRYFVAVAEELNFRRAADRLHVSAPALSVQIRMLEELLSVRLLKRDTKSVSLTIPGEVFLRETKLLLNHLNEVITLTQEAESGKQGILRIGGPGQLGYSFMPTALEMYQKQYPFVDVRLVDLDIELQHAKALEKGEIQIGFVYGPSIPKLKNVEHMLIMDVPMLAVMSSGHPLAKSSSLSLATLANEPILALGEGKSLLHSETINAIFGSRNIKMGMVKIVPCYEVFMAMLASGQRVSLLPEMKSVSLVEGVAVRPLKESGPDLRFQLYAIWKKKETSCLVKNFIHALDQSKPLKGKSTLSGK